MQDIKTKIITTIGPATINYEVFQRLVLAGIDYIRINSSYGDFRQYDIILKNLRKADPEGKIQVIYDIKNMQSLQYAKDNGLSVIALSFVEDVLSIQSVRKKIPNSFCIAKIESKKGVSQFDQILKVADGIMIARGDLGKAETLEKVPPLQKDFTQKTLAQHKFLITATEMLLSMVYHPEPTRAEVSDVANAVFEHSSALMLSEETAVGSYPVECVEIMRKIIYEAEQWNKLHKT